MVPLASSVIVSDMANVSSLTMQPNSSLDMFEPLQSDLKDKSIRKTGTKRWCKKGKTCMRRCKKAKKCKGRCKKCRKNCKKKCQGENKDKDKDKEKDETVSNNFQSKDMIECTALHAYALLLT